MATELVLTNSESPYLFKSLGVKDSTTYEYVESTLFPIGQIVEITTGAFPINDYNDIYQKTYIISGISVRVVGYTSDCSSDQLNKNAMALIQVVAADNN
jgi:hypothetical protein